MDLHPATFGLKWDWKGNNFVSPTEFKSEIHHPAAVPKFKRWVRLESNPTLLNKYAAALGVPDEGKSTVAFCEIYGLDPGLLSFIPRPVFSVVLLFPWDSPLEIENKRAEEKRIESKGQTVSSNLYYMKQLVGDACGTVAVLHSLLNAGAVGAVEFKRGSFLSKFGKRTGSLSPDERGWALTADAEIESKHEVCASASESDAKHDTNRGMHFVTFAGVDGDLYELDGRKPWPVNHGSLQTLGGGDVLLAAAAVIQRFMARNPEDLRFNMVALCRKSL